MKKAVFILPRLGLLVAALLLVFLIGLAIFSFFALWAHSDAYGPYSETIHLSLGVIGVVGAFLTFVSAIAAAIAETKAINDRNNLNAYSLFIFAGIVGLSPFFLLTGIFGKKAFRPLPTKKELLR